MRDYVQDGAMRGEDDYRDERSVDEEHQRRNGNAGICAWILKSEGVKERAQLTGVVMSRGARRLCVLQLE